MKIKLHALLALSGMLLLSCPAVQAQSTNEPPHPILGISGSGSGAGTILSTWTEAQYTNNFIPQQGPRDDLFAPAVVSGDTGWSWSSSTPNQIKSTPSNIIFPNSNSAYPVHTQAVTVLSGRTVQVPYYDQAGSTSSKSFVPAYIDMFKRDQLRSDFNKLAPAYVNSGSSPATRNDTYARRIAIAFKSWADYYPHYFMTPGWNKRTLLNVTTNYIFTQDNQRASDHNGLAHEWEDDELLAFDAIYDSVALTNLSTELGFDVRDYIKSNLFFFEGDMIVQRVPIDVAILSNLPRPFEVLPMVARVLNRPDYMIWEDQYLEATVRKKIRRDGALEEGAGYSIGYLNGNIAAAQNTKDYFLTRAATNAALLAISNNASSYLKTLKFGQAQWGTVALPNGQLASFGDTPFNNYFSARNTGTSDLLPAYGTLSLGAGSGSQAVQLNQNFSGDNNHMRSDTTALTLWAFNNEVLGNIRYHNGTPGRQFTEQILAYNAVTIDRSDMSSPDADTYGNGDLTIFEPGTNGLAVTEIDGQRAYNNKASRYQRILLLNTVDLTRPYVVDVFRVTGGATHDYLLHGSIRYDQTYECSFPLLTNTAAYPMLEGSEVWVEPTSSGSSFPYYGFWRNVNSNSAPGDFQITYRDTSASHRDLRLWMTDDGSAKVYIGRTPVPLRTNGEPANFWANNLWRPSSIIRKRIPSGTLQDLFVSVIEPMNGGASTIQSVDRLPVSGSSLESCALRITFTDGRVDTYVVNLRNPQVAGANGGSPTVSTADGQYVVTGRVGAHMDRPSDSRTWTINATDFQYPSRRLTTPNTYYSGLIAGETRKFTGGSNDAFFTTTPLPLGTALRGKQLSFGFGALSGSGTNGISELFEIDQVLLTNGQYHICFTNDHMLEITNGTTTVEQMAPLRKFTTSNSFEIVLSASTAPISPLADITIPVSGTSTPLNFNYGNLGVNPGASLQVLAIASNPTLLPPGALVIGGSGTNRTLTLTPTPGQSGTAIVTVSVTDGVWTNSRSFNVIVSSYLVAATPLSQSVSPGGSTNFSVSLSATNGFTGTTTFGITGLPPGVGASFNPPTVNGTGTSTLLLATTASTVGGTYPLSLTATSGSLASTTTVALVIGGVANLRWNSSSSSAWDTNTANWLNLGNSAPDVFAPQDSVLFDDTPGVVTNVTIAAGVSVIPTLLANASDTNGFTISGSGKLSGSASIVKSGTSTLTVSTANDFTGTVTVQGGVLKTGNASSLGFTSGITIITNGGTLDVNGVNLGQEPITVSGPGVAGGGAIINSGAPQTTALHLVTLAGNTTFGGTGRWDIRGSPASLLTGGQPFKLTKVGTNQVSLVAVNPIDSALGDIDVLQGTFAIQTSSAQVGNPNKTIAVYSGATLNIYRLTNSPLNKQLLFFDGATMYSENDSNIILGPVTLGGVATFNVNNAGGLAPSLTFNNALVGPGGLAKIGLAPMVLRGTNTYTGSTLVSTGALVLAGSGSISGSSLITIASGATLDVSGRTDKTLTLASGQTIGGNGTLNGSLVVGTNATVAPGTSTGTLTVTNNVTLQGRTLMQLNKAVPTNDLIRGAVTINYGGTLSLTNVAGTLAPGDSFKLFSASNYTGAFMNVLPGVPRVGLGWDTSGLAADGTLKVVAAAPPAPPRMGGLSWSDTDLTISGTNGVPGGVYYVLLSTNTALPLSSWTRMATNVFDASGGFSFTTVLDTNALQQFYMLQLQ
jgi:autotransporter-associated beta strand protein